MDLKWIIVQRSDRIPAYRRICQVQIPWWWKCQRTKNKSKRLKGFDEYKNNKHLIFCLDIILMNLKECSTLKNCYHIKISWWLRNFWQVADQSGPCIVPLLGVNFIDYNVKYRAQCIYTKYSITKHKSQEKIQWSTVQWHTWFLANFVFAFSFLFCLNMWKQ